MSFIYRQFGEFMNKSSLSHKMILYSLLNVSLAFGFFGCNNGRIQPDRIEGVVKSIGFVKERGKSEDIPEINVNTATGGGFLSSGGKVYDTALNSNSLSIVMQPIGTVQSSDSTLSERVLQVIQSGNLWKDVALPGVLLDLISEGDTISIPRYKSCGSLYDQIGVYFTEYILKK